MQKTLLTKLLFLSIAATALVGCNKKEKKDPGLNPVDSNETTYSLSFNGTLCTANNLNEYDKDSEVSFTITPDFDCVLPEDVTVTGVDDYQFSKETGVLSFTITNDVTVNCVCTRNVYGNVTFNLKNIDIECGERYLLNTIVTAVLTPDEGYKLPLQKDIELTNATILSYSEITGVLSFRVLGDVVITASAIYVPIAARVLSDLLHCTISISKQYNVGDEFSETITPENGYELTDSITVFGLEDGYSFDKTTGVISGIIESNTISVSCLAVEKYYSFSFVGKYCTSSEYLSKYKPNEEVSITITPNSGYELDASMITVNGVDDYEFSIETGVLTVIMTS